MAEHVLIAFEGEGSGSGGLTWGQRGVWRSILSDGEAKTMGGVVATRPGTTVEKVAGSMRYVLCRHQSLRTRLRLGPDGRVGQQVFPSGELLMEVVDVPAGADPAAVAEQVQRRFQTTPYDYERDWPLRAAAIVQDGQVTHSVAVYLHTSLDAQGLTVLVRDLAQHLSGAEPEPVTAMQPLELAAREAGPSAQRQSRLSLQHMESVLRAAPATPWPSTGIDTGEHDTVLYRSPRLALAVGAVAARHGIDTSPVLLGAYALSLARETGINPLAIQLAVSNRFRPRMADSVAPLAQVAPCLIDVADTTVGEVVARAWRGAMSAYKNAYYDPAGRTELVSRLRAECGEQVVLFVFFNDRRTPGQQPDAVEPGEDLAARLEAARDRSTVRWELVAGPMLKAIYLDVDAVVGALELTVTVDLQKLSRAGGERLVRGVEDIAVEMALRPQSPTGVRAGEPAVPR